MLVLFLITFTIILVIEIECDVVEQNKTNTPKHKITTYAYNFDMFGKHIKENENVLSNLYTDVENHEPTNFLQSELTSWTMLTDRQKYPQPTFPDMIEKANTQYMSTRPRLPKVTLKVADDQPWNITIKLIDVGGDTKSYPTIINRLTPNYWEQFTPIFKASNIDTDVKELTVLDKASSYLKDVQETIDDLRNLYKKDLTANVMKPRLPVIPSKSIKRSFSTSSTVTDDDLVWLTDATTASTLGDGAVLFGKVTHLTTQSDIAMSFLKEFNTTNYLSVAFKKMCEYIIDKNSSYVKSVLKHLVIIVDRIRVERPLRLLWLKEPLTTVLNIVVNMLSALPMDELKSHAIILHNAIQNRRAVLDQTVNELIDRADRLVEPHDGENLFKVVLEFRDYPHNTRPAYQLCEALFEAFETPFRYETKSEIIKVFVQDVNEAFLKRFPKLHA